MRTKIIDYRGFEISFDTDSEKFYIFSDSCDREQYKPSFASAKKFIDDFIKDNNRFKPFFLVSNPASKFDRGFKIKVIGISKDNKFIFEDMKGNKQKMSEYDEKYWVYEYDCNTSIIKDIERYELIIDEANSKIKELKKSLTLETAKDIKEKMLSYN